MDRSLLDTRQAAEFLGVNEKQIYTLIHERGLPGTKVTGKWVFPRQLVERWIESNVANMPSDNTVLSRTEGLLLIAGSDDPLLDFAVSLFGKRFPDTIPLRSRAGSSEGLLALRRRVCHIACLHLMNTGGNGYNLDHLNETMGDFAVAVGFARRTQGLIISPGNPLGIGSIQDLARCKARFINREVGTGTRLLLDGELDRRNISAETIRGFDSTAPGHFEVALEVMRGDADAGMGIEAAAVALGLDFIPLQTERFDLAILKEIFFSQSVQDFISLLGDSDFVRYAASLGGYDISDAGRVLLPGKE